MKATRIRPQKLNISFDIEFNDRGALAQSEVSITTVIPNSEPTAAFLFITFSSSIEGISTDFKLQAESIIPYRFDVRIGTSKEDIYECVKASRDYLQGVINKSFEGSSTPLIGDILFEDISEDIDQSHAALNQD